MAHYALEDYQEIEGDNPSIVVAYANLLSRFNRDIDPVVLSRILTQDDPEIDWWSLPEYLNAVQYKEITQEDNNWPEDENAILRFKKDGIDHYCLIADPLAHSIIDSLDGKIKKSPYGNPVGWASYEFSPSVDADDDYDIRSTVSKEPQAQKYLVGDNENIWDAARKTGLRASDIMEFNGITDATVVKPGDILRLPDTKPIVVERQISYEIFSEPKKMHISKPEGAHKWSFGNIKVWEDIQPSGPTHRFEKNVTIAGLARVPVGEDTALYYMDVVSLGDYLHTGKVTYTTGFAWSELEEGHIFQPKPEPVITVVDEPEPELAVNFNEYKTTYRPFEDGPRTYVYTEDLVIHDLDGRRPSKTMYKLRDVLISGTFVHEGRLYGRPTGAIQAGYWFAIPMDKVEMENDIFEVKLSEKTRGSLEPKEHVVVWVSIVLSKYTGAMHKLRKVFKG